MLRDIVKNHIGAEVWKDSFSTKTDIAQLIIDCRFFFQSAWCIMTVQKAMLQIAQQKTIPPWKMATWLVHVTLNLLHPKDFVD